MTRPDAVLRKATNTGQAVGWVHRHPLADEQGVVTWAAAWFAGPDDAVNACLRCGPSGCSPECARARQRGHRGYVTEAQT